VTSVPNRARNSKELSWQPPHCRNPPRIGGVTRLRPAAKYVKSPLCMVLKAGGYGGGAKARAASRCLLQGGRSARTFIESFLIKEP
jgi:hypothetical protein